jgi:hypothetical protein
MALFDIQMCLFVNYSKNQIITNSDIIRESLLELMTSNQEFIDCILLQTSDREKLKKRFEIWKNKLEEIVGEPKEERRNFSFQEKENFLKKNSTCVICGQKILDIDDAELDHKIPFSKGGKTEIENAQLTHRFCNRHKLNKY